MPRGAMTCEVSRNSSVSRYCGFFVGGIEEDEIGEQVAGCHSFQAAQGGSFDQFGALADFESVEVVADQARGFGVRFDEDCFARAAADGFDAYGAGAGEQVHEEGVFECWAEDVEQGFTQAIAGGPEALCPGAFQRAAAIFSGDYTHGLFRF